MESAFDFLQHWYASQCDGVWEHEFGVTIETLDNPGWSVKIDLKKSKLSGKNFEPISISNTELDWSRCWIENEVFRIACGPRNLDQALRVFMDWAHIPV